MLALNNKHLSKTLSLRSARTKNCRKSETEPDEKSKDNVQGEGNYEAAREFNIAERKFVASGKLPASALAAAPKSESERREMFAAEEEGRGRAKDRDPALTRTPPDLAMPMFPGKDANRKRG